MSLVGFLSVLIIFFPVSTLLILFQIIPRNLNWVSDIVSWQIYFKKKKTGGISFNSTLPLTHVDEKLCYQILHEYKIHNAEV